jgi:hypothetical protein
MVAITKLQKKAEGRVYTSMLDFEIVPSHKSTRGKFTLL